jgi:hypothetical protein
MKNTITTTLILIVGCALIAQIAYAQTITPYGTTTTATTPYGKITVTLPKATAEYAGRSARKARLEKDAQAAEQAMYAVQAKVERSRLERERQERLDRERIEHSRRGRELLELEDPEFQARKASQTRQTIEMLQFFMAFATGHPQGKYDFRNSSNSPRIYSRSGEYLGNLNNNNYDPNSISNPYGAGSEFKPNGVNNPYSPNYMPR